MRAAATVTRENRHCCGDGEQLRAHHAAHGAVLEHATRRVGERVIQDRAEGTLAAAEASGTLGRMLTQDSCQAWAVRWKVGYLQVALFAEKFNVVLI